MAINTDLPTIRAFADDLQEVFDTHYWGAPKNDFERFISDPIYFQLKIAAITKFIEKVTTNVREPSPELQRRLSEPPLSGSTTPVISAYLSDHDEKMTMASDGHSHGHGPMRPCPQEPSCGQVSSPFFSLFKTESDQLCSVENHLSNTLRQSTRNAKSGRTWGRPSKVRKHPVEPKGRGRNRYPSSHRCGYHGPTTRSMTTSRHPKQKKLHQ